MVNEREYDQPDVCAICSEDVDPADPLNYYVGARGIVCHRCARQHGGVYNPETENWSRPPRLPSLGQRLPEED